MGGTESSLESVQKVLSLGTNERLTTFADMWYWVFLWALFSSLFVHGAAALIAFLLLRRHRIGRFVPVVIIVMGFLGPILGGTVTSVAFAGVHQAAGKTMAPLEALVFGTGQTVLTIIVSFSRILATL
uniref:transmembrane protein 170B n=1 Tax=Myxine glutinosa TaxID=7769 RepID=UPI00358E9390